MSLKDTIQRLATYWDDIPIRANVDGKRGCFYLTELDDETVGDWIINTIKGVVRNRIKGE